LQEKESMKISKELNDEVNNIISLLLTTPTPEEKKLDSIYKYYDSLSDIDLIVPIEERLSGVNRFIQSDFLSTLSHDKLLIEVCEKINNIIVKHTEHFDGIVGKEKDECREVIRQLILDCRCLRSFLLRDLFLISDKEEKKVLEYKKQSEDKKLNTITTSDKDKLTIVFLSRLYFIYKFLYRKFQWMQIRRYLDFDSLYNDYAKPRIEKYFDKVLNTNENYLSANHLESKNIEIDKSYLELEKSFRHCNKFIAYSSLLITMGSSPLSSYLPKEYTKSLPVKKTTTTEKQKPISHVTDILKSKYIDDGTYTNIIEKCEKEKWITKVSENQYIWNKLQNQFIRFIEWFHEKGMISVVERDADRRWQEFCNDFKIKTKEGIKDIKATNLTNKYSSKDGYIHGKAKKEINEFLSSLLD
jgi:hypothetical protein